MRHKTNRLQPGNGDKNSRSACHGVSDDACRQLFEHNFFHNRQKLDFSCTVGTVDGRFLAVLFQSPSKRRHKQGRSRRQVKHGHCNAYGVCFLHEKLTWIKALCMAAVAAGTYLMIEKKDVLQKDNKRVWLFYAVLSALFAAATSILGKIGIDGVESNLGTFIRTCVVLVMAWLVVLVTRSGKNIKYVPLKELIFILLSGLATGASWLCYFKALKDGPASVVIPIDKLSILVTVAFSYVFFKEKLTAKAFVGLILITVGTLCMLI